MTGIAQMVRSSAPRPGLEAPGYGNEVPPGLTTDGGRIIFATAIIAAAPVLYGP